MKALILRLFVAFVAVAASVACGDDDQGTFPVLEGTGITSPSWNDDNPAEAKEGIVMFSFSAAGAWTASSDADWCGVLTASGGAGECSLRLRLSANTSDTPRTAVLTIRLEGYETPAVFRVTQAEGYSQQGDGRYREVNEWMYDYMESHYLWNEPLPSLPLDYSLDYQQFLTSMLDAVAAQDDVNHEDGVWLGGKRKYYYTYVQSGAPIGASSLAVGQTVNGTGIFLMQPALLPDGVVGLAIQAVTPGSPAAEAGLKRGDFISHVNGTTLTANNYEQLGQLVYNGPVRVTPNDMIWNGDDYRMYPREEVSLGAGRYTDPAIYKHDVLSLDNGRKVGYLVYMGFHCDYDRELLGIFDQFAAAGISDLILDLRYNNGGDVLAADVLATLIAGRDYQGQVLAHFVYNAARTAAGESDDLRIGDPVSNTAPGGYQPIGDALDHAVALPKVYVICSSVTASASEMLVNGLRGLGIEVRMLGTTTNGKNVGMEGISRKFFSYDFLFYPVTFYTENSQGFRDYSNGFVPDFVLDDSGIFPGEFGTTADMLCYAALTWISTGSKPVIAGSSLRRTTLLGDMVSERMARRLGGCLVHPASDR
ncbi:MAG: S41 family peptidase [Alistipes sp.]|jgi:hypothetical protein|uniref:S41 family peptidase n=1 Tax=Alistipes sp. TaxID=1872444 RepID=UPI001D2A3422|nr:S41 family peptidase [Alistipes sp.]MBS6099668.1 PDZ domain-containing protein [Alistipes sp.]HJI20049.1 S41 family peptidase [Rikenellaceae bacterium]